MSYPQDPGRRPPAVPAPPDRAVSPAAARPWSDLDRGWLFDVVTGLLLTGFCGLAWVPQPGLLVLSFGLTLPWIIRRRYPLLSFGVAGAAAIGLVIASGQPVLGIVAVPMLIYSYARWSDRTLARSALLLGMIGSVLGPGRWLFEGLSVRTLGVLLMTTLACAGMVTLAYVIGRRRRERDERLAQSIEARIERERLQAAEQEQRARVAAINERNRIARELHDIVAHSLSVIVVQAEGGRALAGKRPEKAPEVLSTIAETSREALEEMRQMVGLLRSGGSLGDAAGAGIGGSEAGDYLPTPGLPDLQDLVTRTGDRFDLTVYGEPLTVSPALGLTVYRIVQESLTNVLKHAGPRPSSITRTPMPFGA
jgi:signal transduction histidine kinase